MTTSMPNLNVTPPLVPPPDPHHKRTRLPYEDTFKRINWGITLKKLWDKSDDIESVKQYYRSIEKWGINGGYALKLRNIGTMFTSQIFLDALVSVPEINEFVFGRPFVDTSSDKFIPDLVSKLTDHGMPFNTYVTLSAQGDPSKRTETLQTRARWMRLILVDEFDPRVDNIARYSRGAYANGKPFVDNTVAIEESWLRRYHGQADTPVHEEFDDSITAPPAAAVQPMPELPAADSQFLQVFDSHQPIAAADLAPVEPNGATPFDFLAAAVQEATTEAASAPAPTHTLPFSDAIIDQLIERISNWERSQAKAHASELEELRIHHARDMVLLKTEHQDRINELESEVQRLKALLSAYGELENLLPSTIESTLLLLDVLRDTLRHTQHSVITPEDQPQEE